MPKPLSIEPVGDRQLVITRDFDAPRDLVFLCYSKPELMRRWYGMPDWTMTVCEIDFRVGGKWRFATRSPDGVEMGAQGVYVAIAAPERIAQTEYYDDDWTQGGSENLVVFTAIDGGTRTVTTVTYSSPEARAGAAASPMAEGMEIGFQRLDTVLAEERRA